MLRSTEPKVDRGFEVDRGCAVFKQICVQNIMTTVQGRCALTTQMGIAHRLGPYHFDDDLIERLDAPDDVSTPLIRAQQRQRHPKEHRNEYDAQHVHVCGCCNYVVRDEVSQQLQECLDWGLCLWVVPLKVPEDQVTGTFMEILMFLTWVCWERGQDGEI